MMPRQLWICLFLLAVAVMVAAQPVELDPVRWEEDIARFEEMDCMAPPPQDAILFIGSSSIRMWDLERFFPDMPVINRGFGGSHIEDSLYYFNRIILPYRPQLIVFYAGDNDVNSGKSPQRVLTDYQALVDTVHAQLPETRVVFIAIKPSPARWDKVEAMREANRLIAEFSQKDERRAFVDIDAPMIGQDGMPREAFYHEDQLHLSERGYELWSTLLRPWLELDG